MEVMVWIAMMSRYIYGLGMRWRKFQSEHCRSPQSFLTGISRMEDRRLVGDMIPAGKSSSTALNACVRLVVKLIIRG